jgi:diguanylate cyclase (GGDEF)-like protein/PAS domain S-box-containing protein
MKKTMSPDSKLVLVVDDEELNVDMLSRRLIRAEFAVHTAYCGEDALSLISQHSYDVVLLDHMMPNMTGREVLATLRETYSPEVLPIIMVTAVAESDRIAEALICGANDYITKPIDFRVALARIQTQLARKDAEAALRASEERYALAVKASRDGLWDWDLKADQIYFSPRWMEMTGSGLQGRVGNLSFWLSLVFESDREALEKGLRQHLSGEQEWFSCEYRMQLVDNSMRWMTTRAVITRDESGRAIRVSGSQSDVSEEKTRDPLTQLPNRVALNSVLESTFLRYRTPAELFTSQYALLFLDLDGFKYVNDSLGHLAGDELLRTVARRLESAAEELRLHRQEILRVFTTRVSGDEFAILVESNAPEQDAHYLAQRIQTHMAKPSLLDGAPVTVAFSIGIAAAAAEHSHYEILIAEADTAMYAAKANGRGSVISFTPDLRESAAYQREMEGDLSQALVRNEFFLLYQPKVRLQDGSMCGVEALIRWQHPVRGLISPGTFIPIAEQTGDIVPIGRWVLETACNQILALHREHPLDPPLELSVNLSPREFKEGGLIQGIKDVLQATGFPPQYLHLEITEGVLFEELDRARESLVALKSLGVGLELDDFGSGYSSLRYLQELPFDTLKIDRYFVSSLDANEESSVRMLQTIVMMASNLNLRVVAEGIEHSPHAQRARDLGCDLGQGYHFSRPIQASQLADMLQKEADKQRCTPAACHVAIVDEVSTCA